MMAAPAAHAFTMEGPAVDNPYAVPKFDLEEQAKGFSKNGRPWERMARANSRRRSVTAAAFSSASSRPGFGFNGLGFGPASRASRDDFNRMVMPENLR